MNDLARRIDAALPQTQCTRCGYPDCASYALAIAAGLLCGAVQTLRGAHPPSHTLWTLLICGGVALAGWSLGPAGGRRSAASPAESEAQGQVDQHADHDGPEHAAAPEEPGRARRR